jgi:hypothetical protein
LKKIAVILLLLVTLFSQTELHQVMKLPAFIQHFFEHRSEKSDMSLADFIAMHYLHGSPKDDDYDKDMQLPFKTVECAASVTLDIIPSLPFSAVQPVSSINRSYPSLNNNSIRFSHTADIWQPPKFS